jgi:hypothetical protein
MICRAIDPGAISVPSATGASAPKPHDAVVFDCTANCFQQMIRSRKETTTMAYDVDQLLKMSQSQLDELFTGSAAGDIPNGEAAGTAIIAPGTTYTKEIATFIEHFAWKGKVFDREKGVLKNRLLAIGFHAIIAKVYKTPSWLDGKECIVLDYSDTSVVAHWIRDEIRQIGPGLYLGKVYWEKKRLIDFALQF